MLYRTSYFITQNNSINNAQNATFQLCSHPRDSKRIQCSGNWWHVLWYRPTNALKKHAASVSGAATCLLQVLVNLYETTQHHIPKDGIFLLKKGFLPLSTLKINYLCHLHTAEEIMQYDNVSVHENKDWQG